MILIVFFRVLLKGTTELCLITDGRAFADLVNQAHGCNVTVFRDDLVKVGTESQFIPIDDAFVGGEGIASPRHVLERDHLVPIERNRASYLDIGA